MRPRTELGAVLRAYAIDDGGAAGASRVLLEEHGIRLPEGTILRVMHGCGDPEPETIDAIALYLDAWRGDVYDWSRMPPSDPAEVNLRVAAGRARAESLPAERRTEIARHAAEVRWHPVDDRQLVLPGV